MGSSSGPGRRSVKRTEGEGDAAAEKFSLSVRKRSSMLQWPGGLKEECEGMQQGIKGETFGTEVVKSFASGVDLVLDNDRAQAFADCYHDLYQADRASRRADLFPIPAGPTAPRLSLDNRESLEVDITVEELRVALVQLQPRKAPGPNGFLHEYWCLVWPQAGQPTLELFRELLEKGRLPLDLWTADIVLQPKPRTAGLHCKDFRPISLLSTEVKV
ncbi:hypothetical protein NDU88_005434 [Pleurodeles waltl]|uniref:Uncharacterized protein n=1 Tax=Pleurodeles waltl TaxID=8319 RepID=A0AAV7MGV7_PLEWA|nr:hypothetical protein NDU88_005434 [Pleurodeles waltl]